jgi:hypothetical protein
MARRMNANAYRPFTVLRRATGEVVGSVEAQSAEQAVFRLAGGPWGRDDFAAFTGSDRPMAAPGLTSYRYRNGRFGFVMIGAADTADALREAGRSITGAPDLANLEIWSASALAYVPATEA